MATTLRDIAKEVGVSVTTVSRALHNYNDVSSKTKALVRQVADEMGYSPNIQAQRLQKKRSDTIGFIIPTFGPRFSDPFFSEFLTAVGNTAAKRGFDLLVSTRAPGEEEMASYRQKINGRSVDGFIVLRTRRHDPRIAYLCDSNYPFVVFGRTEDELDFPFVDEDSHFGMALVAEHLVGLGHRRIGCITPPQDLMFAHYRLTGLQQSLEKLGSPLDSALICSGDLTQRGGYQEGLILLDMPDPPTAIVACNDLMAHGAMRAAHEHGLRVGEDISITGFDDIPLSEHTNPSLTTVHQPIYRIGTMVCEMLISLILGEILEEKYLILEPSLVVRESSGLVPS